MQTRLNLGLSYQLLVKRKVINSKDQVDHEIDHEANEPLVKPGAKFSMESVTLKTRSFFPSKFQMH